MSLRRKRLTTPLGPPPAGCSAVTGQKRSASARVEAYSAPRESSWTAPRRSSSRSRSNRAATSISSGEEIPAGAGIFASGPDFHLIVRGGPVGSGVGKSSDFVKPLRGGGHLKKQLDSGGSHALALVHNDPSPSRAADRMAGVAKWSVVATIPKSQAREPIGVTTRPIYAGSRKNPGLDLSRRDTGDARRGRKEVARPAWAFAIPQSRPWTRRLHASGRRGDEKAPDQYPSEEVAHRLAA